MRGIDIKASRISYEHTCTTGQLNGTIVQIDCLAFTYYTHASYHLAMYLGVCRLTLPLPCFSVQIKHKICKNMNSVQQQHEHHHQKVLIESFHLSGHTFRFHWMVQDLEVFRMPFHFALRIRQLYTSSQRLLLQTLSNTNCRKTLVSGVQNHVRSLNWGHRVQLHDK